MRFLILLLCIIPAAAQENPFIPPEGTAISKESELLIQILAEIRALRADISNLAAEINTLSGASLEAILEENRRLRAMVQERFSELPQSAPRVPRPGSELLDQVLSEPAPLEPEFALPPPGEFSYTVVKEWGRSPEEVAAIPGEAKSLKGMVIAVPAWSSDEELIALGRELRKKYANYENINIEAYTNPSSAQEFADLGSTNPDHRVMNVSKVAQTGRDVILIIRGDLVRSYSPDGTSLEPIP